MWIENALKVASQVHSELFLGSKSEPRRAPPSARNAPVATEDVHPAHPTSGRPRHNPFETRVGAANAADRLARHVGARSTERGGVGGRATASRPGHRFHPYATADRGAGTAFAFKTPAPRARLAFGEAGDGDPPRGGGFADPLQSSFLGAPGDTAPPRFARYTAWRGADGVGARHPDLAPGSRHAGAPATAPARRQSLFAPRAPPPLRAGGALSSRGEPAADLTFEESALRTRAMAHRGAAGAPRSAERESARSALDEWRTTNDAPAVRDDASPEVSFYAHGPRPFDPRARASPGAPSAETLELAKHRALVAGARLTASLAERAAAETEQTASLREKARFRPGYAAAAARAAREPRRSGNVSEDATANAAVDASSRLKLRSPLGAPAPSGDAPVSPNQQISSVSAILFDAEALAAYETRVAASRAGGSNDAAPLDASRARADVGFGGEKKPEKKSALSPLQTRGVEVEAAASRAARDGDPAFRAREDEVARLIEEMSVRAKALEKRRPSARAAAEEAAGDVAALEAALTAPLTAEQEAAVDDALAPGPPREVLASGTFAWQGDLSFTRKDAQTMMPGEWLNDEMVNFTVGAMAAREAKRVPLANDEAGQPRTHFMSTFFTKKLCGEGGRAYDYNAVRRWTTRKKLGYDALLCDTIVVPVHQGIHWVLATVELKERRVRLYDSLHGEDHFLLDCLKRWVRDEYENKKGEAVDTSDWAAEHPKEIPRQMNGCDCGVFMLKYADYIASGCPLTFTQADMGYFRRRIVADGLEAGKGGGD